jgi:hypothetical protein
MQIPREKASVNTVQKVDVAQRVDELTFSRGRIQRPFIGDCSKLDSFDEIAH